MSANGSLGFSTINIIIIRMGIDLMKVKNAWRAPVVDAAYRIGASRARPRLVLKKMKMRIRVMMIRRRRKRRLVRKTTRMRMMMEDDEEEEEDNDKEADDDGDDEEDADDDDLYMVRVRLSQKTEEKN